MPANVLEKYNNLYDQIYAKLNTSYKPQNASVLKDNLQQIIRPSYQQQIDDRRQATDKNRAAIATDAGARGMGNSSWVDDMNNRALDSEAKDLSNIESNYNSALYSALMSRLNQQDELALSAANAAQSNALALTNQLYDKYYAKKSGGGGGGYRGRGSSSGGNEPPYDPVGAGNGNGTTTGTKSVANAMYWGEGQKAKQAAATTAASQQARANAINNALKYNNAVKAGNARTAAETKKAQTAKRAATKAKQNDRL